MAEEKKKSGFLSSLGKLGGKKAEPPPPAAAPAGPESSTDVPGQSPARPDPAFAARVGRLEKELAALRSELAETKKEAERPRTEERVTKALGAQAEKLEILETSFRGLEEIKASDRLNELLEKVLAVEGRFSAIERDFPKLRNEAARVMDDYKGTAVRLKAQVAEAGSEAMSLKATMAAVEEKASSLEARFGPALEKLVEEQERLGRSFAEVKDSLSRALEARQSLVIDDLRALRAELSTLKSDWKLALETRLRHVEAKASAFETMSSRFETMSSRFETLLEEFSRVSGRPERHKK